ncbi:MAG: hypothetical protein ACOCV1_06725 [Bacillota bacterium]
MNEDKLNLIKLVDYKHHYDKIIDKYNMKYNNINDYIAGVDMVKYIEDILNKKNLKFVSDFKRCFYQNLVQNECDRIELNNACLDYAIEQENNR